MTIDISFVTHLSDTTILRACLAAVQSPKLFDVIRVQRVVRQVQPSNVVFTCNNASIKERMDTDDDGIVANVIVGFINSPTLHS